MYLTGRLADEIMRRSHQGALAPCGRGARGIEANPTYETLVAAVALIRREGYDFLLAVGGGSVIDGTKFIAAAAFYDQGGPRDILAKDPPVSAALPFGTVLTLPATGSEMDATAFITRRALKAKSAFMSERVFSPLFPPRSDLCLYHPRAADRQWRGRQGRPPGRAQGA